MLIAINFATAPVNLDLRSLKLPSEGKVEFYSGPSTSHTPGAIVPFDSVTLDMGSGIIISFNGADKYNEMPEMVDNCFIQLKVCYNNALGIVQTC